MCALSVLTHLSPPLENVQGNHKYHRLDENLRYECIMLCIERYGFAFHFSSNIQDNPLPPYPRLKYPSNTLNNKRVPIHKTFLTVTFA